MTLGAQTEASARGKGRVPAGMIPYDKPVFKNGRRVLYHGPGRGRSRAEASRAAPAGAAAAAGAETAASEPLRLTAAMDPLFGAELAQAVKTRGVDLVVAPEGPADLFLMTMPVGAAATSASAAAANEGKLAIARLFDCEIVVVGRAPARSIGDLAGKRVAAPPATLATGRIARRLFSAAGVAVSFVDAAPGAGAKALRLRAADAYVMVSPAPDLSDAPTGARILSAPYVGALREQFLPTELGKAAFPKLIDGESVDTVAQPVLLATTDPGRDPAKRAALARFTEAFFSALGAGAMPHAKWRDVNPAARLPISRFEAAQAWIDKKPPAN